MLVGLLVGGEIVSICIDPNLGGETKIDRLLRHTPRPPTNPHEAMFRTPAQTFWSWKAAATLGAGYVLSSIAGFLFMVSRFVCAFDYTSADPTNQWCSLQPVSPLIRTYSPLLS